METDTNSGQNPRNYWVVDGIKKSIWTRIQITLKYAEMFRLGAILFLAILSLLAVLTPYWWDLSHKNTPPELVPKLLDAIAISVFAMLLMPRNIRIHSVAYGVYFVYVLQAMFLGAFPSELTSKSGLGTIVQLGVVAALSVGIIYCENEWQDTYDRVFDS